MVSKQNTVKIAAASFGTGLIAGWLLHRYTARVMPPLALRFSESATKYHIVEPARCTQGLL
jgi:hypothetical protein